MFKHIFSILFFCHFIVFSQHNPIENILLSGAVDDDKIQQINTFIANTDYTSKEQIHDLKKYLDWQTKKRYFKEAIITAEKIIEEATFIFQDNDCYIQNIEYVLGSIYYRTKDFDTAIEIFHKIISQENNCDSDYKIYNAIALTHQKKGDYFKAIDYLKYVYTMLSEMKSNSINSKKIITTAINISLCHNRLGGHENITKGRNYLLKADSLSQTINLDYNKQYKLNTALFNTFNFDETLNITKGNHYIDKALNVAKKLNDSAKIRATLTRKGNLYNTTDQDIAIYYHKQAIKYIPHGDDTSIQLFYRNLAYCYLMKKDYEESRYFINKLMKELTGKSTPELVKDHRVIYSINTQSLDLIFLFLNYYCQTLTETNNPSKDQLIEALKIYQLADELIDIIQINCTEKTSRLFWRKKASQLYSNAIHVCYQLNNTSEAFHFMEKNRVLILMEDLHLEKLKNNKKLPQSLIASVKKSKTNIYILNKEFQKTKATKTHKKLLVEKELLAQLNDSIKKSNPFPTQIHDGHLLTSLTTIQHELSKDSYVIEYLIHEDIGYGLYISKDTASLFELKNIDTLQKNTDELLQKMSVPFTTKEDQKQYHKLALAVYNQLFPEEHIRKKIENKKLIIIPDNFLNYLPFEALSINEKNYLIEKNEISYVFSNSIQKNADYKINDEQPITLFAPESFNHGNLVSLKNSIKEITAINTIIDSDLFMQNDATKAQFLEQLPHSKIIHLATHANAHDSIAPWIAFNDQKLTLEELYLTKNDAELVVLSGCKTNKGKLEVGEGVMSLSRGFFQTGSQSVVSSLWNVDDKATPKIISSFYKNLKKGKTKSKALRLAKLNYIKNHSLSEASPYYWAPLVLVGNTNAIDFSDYNWIYYLIIGGLLLLFIIYASNKKIKKYIFFR